MIEPQKGEYFFFRYESIAVKVVNRERVFNPFILRTLKQHWQSDNPFVFVYDTVISMIEKAKYPISQNFLGRDPEFILQQFSEH